MRKLEHQVLINAELKKKTTCPVVGMAVRRTGPAAWWAGPARRKKIDFFGQKWLFWVNGHISGRRGTAEKSKYC